MNNYNNHSIKLKSNSSVTYQTNSSNSNNKRMVMEILMKLKCSPTGPGNTPSLSTIKIINHQQPVKQHSVGGTTSALHLQGKPSTIINHHHHHPHHPHLSRSQPQPQTQSHHSNHPQHLQGHSQNMSAMIQDILPQGRPAVVVPNATSSPIDCCIGMPRSFITRPSVPPPSNNDCTNLCYEGSTQFCPSSVTSNQHSSVSPGGLSCNGPSNVRPPTLALCNTQQSVIVNRTAPPTIISSRTLKPNIPGPSVYANGSYDLHPINQQQSSLQGGYAYEDTEEDFVSIDDAKIKSFLMKMGNKPQNSPNRQETPTPPQSNTPVKMDEDDDDTILTFDEEFPKQKRLVSPLSINKTPVALRRDITTINAALNNTATAKKSSPSPSIPNQKTETNRINQESKDTLENNKSLINNNINNNDKNNINNNNNNIINNNNNTSNKIPNTNTNNNNSNSKTLEYQRPQSSPSTNGFNSSKEAIQRNGTNNSSQEIPSNGVGNPRKEITNIVANIDLLDSSDEEDVNEQEPPFDDNVYEEDEVDVDEDDDDDDDDDEDDYPLAALSCELQLEDEDDLPLVPATKRPRYNELNGGDITDIESDLDDDDIADYIVGKERGVELKWDDFRDKQPNAPPAVSINSSTSVQSNSQKDKDFQAHECHLCGKVVQSSYNLRRHMMIHTGERPFGCDMCERRFREFSDLKKHRRRHLNEPGYICMICRIGKPSTTDSTRCYTCEYKQIPPKFFADKYKPTSAAADLANEAYSVALSAVMNEYRKSPPIASQPPPPPPPPPTLAKKPSMNHNSGKSSPPSLQQAPRISPVNLVYTPTPPPLPAQGQTQAQAQSQVQAQAQATKRAATPPLPPLTPISRSSSTSSHSDAWLSQISNMQTSKSPSINGSSSSNSNTNNTNSNGQSGLKKEFQCPLCDRSFGTRHNLKRHFMIHTGEKPFSCSECRKPFRESSTLKKHMVTHLRDRWYKCSRCSHAFHDYLDYMDHKLVHDGEEDSDTLMTNDTMDETELRRRSYEIYDSNDEDEDEDDEEDWLDCYECNQRFTNLDEYNEHIKEHDLNHSSYECYICKKHFESREILEKHITLCKRE